ncbi:MAG: peptidase MA family metallohydrolase [Anaerolineae bacterium]|nr:peptidase MA family metallohydrolase [Anaerolineae bacterium]
MKRYRCSGAPRVLLVVVAVLCWSMPATSVAADSPISVVEQSTENHFPDELLWHITVRSEASQITRIKLVFGTRGNRSPTSVPLSFEPATEVSVQHRWYTKYRDVPPGAPILFHWVIGDAAGNELVSEEQIVYYDDIRFSWQQLANEQVALFWYEGDQAFGQELFGLANEAIERLATEIGARPAFQVRIVIYPSEETFFSAFPRMQEWVGGRAFSEMGLTVQIISPETSMGWSETSRGWPETSRGWSETSPWPRQVIPHEIAHLLFYQATYHPLSDPPAWLNEGLAQHCELVSHAHQEKLVRDAARHDSLLPLPYLTGSFGSDPEQVSLAYAQSLSMVEYALRRFGPEGMAALMAAYREGQPTRQAMPAAWGVSQEAFYEQWKAATLTAEEAMPLDTVSPAAVLQRALLVFGLTICCCSTSLLTVAVVVGVLLFKPREM